MQDTLKFLLLSSTDFKDMFSVHRHFEKARNSWEYKETIKGIYEPKTKLGKEGKNLIIHSEEEGAPAPWAKTTTGDNFSTFDADSDVSISPSLLCRQRFAGGESIPSENQNS